MEMCCYLSRAREAASSGVSERKSNVKLISELFDLTFICVGCEIDEES